jgi:chromosome segregation ATPase
MAATPGTRTMGLSSYLRNLVGAVSKADLDAASSAAASAREARGAAEEMKLLVARTRDEVDQQLLAVQDELKRLAARLEAMPEMRSQLESFVQSLGRTMTQAADRLDTVDDRLHHMEQQSRSQTEVLSLSRSELDRQGRLLSSLEPQMKSLEPQMKSLEEAVARLAAATERTEAMVREFDGRTLRTARTERVMIVTAVIVVVAAAVVLLRGG